MTESLYKDARGIEFCDLMERMRARGYKPADVARLCHLSKAAVSGYLSGAKMPGIRTLIIFRDVVTRELAESAGTMPSPKSAPLVEQLRQLESSYPEGFEAVASLVRTLLGKVGGHAVKSPGPAQAALAEAHTLLEKAEKMADAGAPPPAAAAPAKSSGTDGPKSRPRAGVSSRTRKRPAPPGPPAK
jgi:transcriptional regulator with XRE-family HTH domain